MQAKLVKVVKKKAGKRETVTKLKQQVKGK